VAHGRKFLAADFLRKQRAVPDFTAAGKLRVHRTGDGAALPLEGDLRTHMVSKGSPDLDPDKTGITGARLGNICIRVGSMLYVLRGLALRGISEPATAKTVGRNASLVGRSH
jgi:hypothetical protein